MKGNVGRNAAGTQQCIDLAVGQGMRHQLRVLAFSFGLATLVAWHSAAATNISFSVNPGAPEQATSDESERGASPVHGDGIVLATGNKVEDEKDFAVDEEMGLYLQRTYNHHWNGIGLFGKHWLSNFDYSLAFSSGVAWAQRPDGRRIKFLSVGASRWNEDKAQWVAYLIRNADGTYTLYNEERGIETYNADGYITQRRNEQGIVWTFTYNGKYLQSVSHSSNRSVQFGWTNGQITQVTDPAGNVYQYTYTPNVFGTGRGRLASTVLPGSPAMTVAYHYEDSRFPGALTGKSFNGVRYSTIAYDDQARAIQSENAGGANRYRFSYVVEGSQPLPLPPPPPPPGGYQQDQYGEDESAGCIYQPGTGKICYQVAAIGVSPMYATASLIIAAVASSTSTQTSPTRLRVTETNPLGRQTVYIFENGRMVSVESGSKVGARTYDANGYLNLVHDFEEGVTDYDYDEHGHLIRKVEAAGTSAERITTFVWDETKNRLLQETVTGQRETTYTYKPDGRVERISEKNLSNRGSAGQVRQTVYGYSYKSNGMLDTKVVDGPVEGALDAIIYAFGTTYFLQSVTNGPGQTTTYAGYNGLGQPGQVTGPNGDVAEYTYDGRGRVTAAKAIVNGTAQTTSYAYNGLGLLDLMQMPDGRQRRFVYDAASRLIEEYEREPGGTYARKLTAYNAASLVTQVEVRRSTYPYNTQVIGNIDGVAGNGAGGYNVRGWACSTGQDAPIEVHLYAGGGWPTGTGLGGFQANQGSEPAVAAACAAQGSAYRFQISLSDAMRDQHGGKAIYIHGISPAQNGNPLIGASGIYLIPRLLPNVAPSGLSAPSQSTSGSYTATWSATPRATWYRLEESTNGGAWTVIHDQPATSKAVSGKAAGTYRYRVAACNEIGCGPTSGEVSVREIDPPTGAPSLSAPAVNTTGSYTVSWNAVADATTYKLEEIPHGGTWATVHDASATSKALTGKSTAVPYYYRAQACNEAGCGGYSGTITVQPVVYGAEFVGQSVPTLMAAGRGYAVTVQMRNTGNTTWTDADAYRLGAQNPHDNTYWGTGRVYTSGAVPPGGIATYTFNAVAPAAVGTYNFQWRMVRDGVTWFGATTPNVAVSVASGSISANPNPCSLYITEALCTSRISWSSSRGGSEVWVTNIDGSSPQLFYGNTQNGNAYANWIPTSGKRFHLISSGVTLATVDVYAYQTGQYPPEPDPPPCPTQYCQEP